MDVCEDLGERVIVGAIEGSACQASAANRVTLGSKTQGQWRKETITLYPEMGTAIG
jgi:hypothetical protein